jgi:MYXO-CTERM domain-containing protein
MSVPASSTGAAGPVRFARTRTVLAVLVVVGILVSLVANCARTLTNTDTYFHLRFGQEFLHGWSLRHPGSVSTFATRDWVPTQWLSEVAMAKTEDWFGLAGVAWLSGLLEIGLFLALYVVCRDRAEPSVAAAATATALFAMQSGLSMRPQVISYLLVAVVVGAWLRTSRDGRRVRWWLIPVTWVWAMLHGMWPVAVVIGIMAVVGLALDRVPRGLLVRAGVIPLASAVVAALTPVGPELYTAVAAVGSRSQYFAEWGSPDWTSWEFGALTALLVLTVLAMWRRRRNAWTEILLVGLAAGFAVYSQRTVPVAAAMSAPLLAGPLQGLLGRRTPVGRRERVVVAGGALAALVALAVAVPYTSADPPHQAAWMDPTLSALPPGTKVLDDWDQGGYFMWRYPQLDLVMHGYGDTFTTEELRRNTGLIALDPGWETSLRESGARVALLRPWSRLAYVLAEQGWRVVHESDAFELLRAPDRWVSVGPAVAPRFGSAG